ncbi:MAG: SpoIIE family protein phosphatase [Bacteroidales bacterium]|nr:SpoIIE family protein phosphatase [Bacteroidales bacterium]
MRFCKTFRFIVCIASISLSLSCFAQELGRYPIHNFNHRDYKGHLQNWAVVQDLRGLIYVANNDGVLEYDGSNWRQISINDATTRCLDIDSEGRIWVGGQDEFGYLAADSAGSMRYYSLASRLPSNCSSIGLVRQVFATKEGVFFSSNQHLIQIKERNIRVWKPKTYFHRAYFVSGKLFVNQPDYGLTYLQNDSLKLAPQAHEISKELIYLLLPYNNDKLLVGTQLNGFYTYNINAFRADTIIHKDSILCKFKTSDDSFFKENLVYNGISLPNNNFAVSTSRKGVVLINKNGEILRKINQSSNLQDEAVWGLFLDNQENLWMALNNGISYTSINSQLTNWNDNSGLRGTLLSITRYQGTIYLSTNIGIFRLANNEFQEVQGVAKFSFCLLNATSSDNKTSLLAGTADGIYQIEGNAAIKVENGKYGTYKLFQSKVFPNIIYAGLINGIGVLKCVKGKWMFLGRLEDTRSQVYSLIEDQNGFLWYTERYKGIHKINVVNPYQLISEHLKFYNQLPFSPKYDVINLSLIDKSLKVSTEKGLCQFDYINDRFLPDSSLGVEFTEGKTGIKILNQDTKGNLWFEVYKNNPNRWIERAVKYPDNTYRRVPAQFRTIPDMVFNNVFNEEGDINWIASSDGLYRFDGNIRVNSQSITKVLIRRIVANQSKLIFNGAVPSSNNSSIYRSTNFSQTNNTIQKFHSNENSVIFYFSSPFFGQNQSMKYSYILEGYDKQWSEWSTDQKKEYTNLPFGNFKFIVKARNIFDSESPVASYSFSIKRPWYKTAFSYTLLLITLISFIWLYVTVKTKLLKRSNIRLQALVVDRTKEILEYHNEIVEKNEELMQQKEEMQVQRDELHEQNRQITASLEYAKTIQQAILPDLSILKDRIEHFIIYKPKDVVSGDFYWISRITSKTKQSEKIIVAVVDCTGHGVPGAFMSMIGSRILSEIVNERKIHSPAEILTELNISVNQALRQDVSDSFDGMDACLCLIEPKLSNQYIITFAGANRMLYYYQKGTHNIQTLKGNRKTIGGIMPEVDPEFVNNRIYLSPDDIIFLNSDGIVDQNNESRKKYKASRFHASILAHVDKPMYEMGVEINKMFEGFKGNTSQRDDITVLGLRLLEDRD